MSSSPRRPRLVAAAVVGVLVVVTAVGLVGLIGGPGASPAGSPPTTGTAAPRPTTSPDTGGAHAVAVTGLDDGVRFARAVAAVLFDWDTTTQADPGPILDAVLAVGDPSGQDVPGLYADVTGYLPTRQQWAQLREYGTRQHLEVTSARVPNSWPAVLADKANGLVPGTVAVTIDGTRVRNGGWFDQTTTLRAPVAFTVFALCPPATDDGCRLLRLSGLDDPLR